MTPNSWKVRESFWCDLWLQVRTGGVGRIVRKWRWTSCSQAEKYKVWDVSEPTAGEAAKGYFWKGTLLTFLMRHRWLRSRKAHLSLLFLVLELSHKDERSQKMGGIGSPGLQQSARKLETAEPANRLIRDIYGKISKLNNS